MTEQEKKLRELIQAYAQAYGTGNQTLIQLAANLLEPAIAEAFKKEETV